MSYILTALKKSQQQRDRGAVPTLSSVAPPPLAPKRRPWPLLMIGGLVLNVAAFTLLAWWLGETLSFGESTAKEVARPAPPAPTEPQVASVQPSVDVVPPKSPSPAPKTDVEANRPSTTLDSAAPRSEVRAASEAETMQPAEATKRAEAGPGAISSHQEASAASAPMPSTESRPPQDQLAAIEPRDVDRPPAPGATHDAASVAPGPQVARLPETELSPPESAEATVDQSPKSSLDPYASLPMLHSLSYTIQTILPDLSILVHVYGEEPGDRFVIIQNRKYREGDALANDLTVEAITPSGAVLRYKDTAFRIEP